MPNIKRWGIVFLFFMLTGSVWGQSTDLPKWFIAGDTGIVFFYPDSWAFVENSSTEFHLAQSQFDLISGQRPHGVVFNILVRPKSTAYSGDGTLLGAFEAQATPPNGQTFAPTEMTNTNIPMMRGDAMLPDNVPWSVIVADVSDDHWIYMSIMHADASTADAILAHIIAESDAEFPEPDILDVPTDDESETLPEPLTDEPAEGSATGYTVMITDVGNQKINVIKAVRSLTSLGLKEAKDLVESAPDAVVLEGVTFAEAEAAKTALETEGATVMILGDEEESTPELYDVSGSYSVVLTDIGNQKINVIKAVRSLTSLGLTDAKYLVESAPDAIVFEGVTFEEAEAARVELEAAGATVALIEDDHVAEEICLVEDDNADFSLVLMEVGVNKIKVIKAVRTITSLGLVEAKDLVESAPDAVIIDNVSRDAVEIAQSLLTAEGATAIIRNATNPNCDDEYVEPSGLFDVVIVEIGARKIDVIKAVRSITSLSLADAKALVESAPDAVVVSGVDFLTALDVKDELFAAGASIAIAEIP